MPISQGLWIKDGAYSSPKPLHLGLGPRKPLLYPFPAIQQDFTHPFLVLSYHRLLPLSLREQHGHILSVFSAATRGRKGAPTSLLYPTQVLGSSHPPRAGLRPPPFTPVRPRRDRDLPEVRAPSPTAALAAADSPAGSCETRLFSRPNLSVAASGPLCPEALSFTTRAIPAP